MKKKTCPPATRDASAAGGRCLCLIAMPAVLFFAQTALACVTGTVRDAALIAERVTYRLCIFAHTADEAADVETQRIRQQIDDPDAKLNVDVVLVRVDDPGLDWSFWGMDGPPPDTPVTALIGEGGPIPTTFVLDYWQPYPDDGEIAAIKTSPAREKIKDGIASHWAVVLYSPGDPALGNEGIRPDDIFMAVEAEWAEKQPPGVAIIQFDRADPAERMLREFSGVEPGGPAWAGVIFGRGKLLAPPLTGSAITPENIGKRLETLAIPCTCLTQSSIVGFDLPMTWDARLDALAAALAPGAGYFETSLGPTRAPQPQAGRRVARVALAAVAAIVMFTVCATAIVAYRARNEAA